MSGSSAIVVAAFKALMEFYGLTLADLNISKEGVLKYPVSHFFCKVVMQEKAMKALSESTLNCQHNLQISRP